LAEISEIITLSDLMDCGFKATPEQILWMAVIERAMIDYLWPPRDLNIKHRNNLVPFLFDTNPWPHNLEYICQNVFEHSDTVIQIRRRIIKMKQDKVPEEAFMRARRFTGY
jgi:hypothetical protein